MKFSLTNIGKIAQADIEINGLTVLGGYNDIGKSTVGKTLFSVIKTISDIEQETKETTIEQVEQELTDFSVKIRKITGLRLSSSVETNKQRTASLGRTVVERSGFGFFGKLEVLIEQLRRDFLFSLSENTDIAANISAYISQFRNHLSGMTSFEDNLIKEEISDLLNLLETNLTKICNLEQAERYKRVFNRINRSLFRGDIQNKKISSDAKSLILLKDSSCQIEISLENNSAKSFFVKGSFPFQNVTLVDSPLVLGWLSAVGVPRSQVKNIFGHYVFDLLNKIRLSTTDSYDAVSNTQKGLVSDIGVVIGGKMYYNSQQRNFIFQQGEMAVQLVNLASGIKTFGIIQMLLTSGTIAANTVLIIDEPEAHLHPEWQLKYAEVLTQLVDMGVYVLVSTHSPYMIEALKHYSDKLQQEKITNFYLGNAGEHGTVFSDVTQDLNPLFKLLAMPMQRLAFEG